LQCAKSRRKGGRTGGGPEKFLTNPGGSWAKKGCCSGLSRTTDRALFQLMKEKTHTEVWREKTSGDASPSLIRWERKENEEKNRNTGGEKSERSKKNLASQCQATTTSDYVGEDEGEIKI